MQPEPHMHPATCDPTVRPSWDNERSIPGAWRNIPPGGFLRYRDGLVIHLSSGAQPGPRFSTMCRKGESAMFSLMGSSWLGRIEDVRGRRGHWEGLVFVPYTGDRSRDRQLLAAAREYAER